MQLNALFRLAFATTPHQRCLIWLHRVSHRLIMQKARGHACHLRDLALPQIVGFYGFRDFFTSLVGELFTASFTVLSFTIGCQGVFSLRRWSSWVPTGFAPLSRGTWGYPSEVLTIFAHGTFTPLRSLFPEALSYLSPYFLVCLNPHWTDPATLNIQRVQA